MLDLFTMYSFSRVRVSPLVYIVVVVAIFYICTTY